MDVLETLGKIGIVISVLYLLFQVAILSNKIKKMEMTLYPALRNKTSKRR